MSSEETEENPGLRTLKIIGAILLMLIIVVSFIMIITGGVMGGAHQFVGVWKSGRTQIKIEAKPKKEIKEVHKLRDGKEAKLLLPVRVRSVKGQDLWLMTREGIYDVDGEYALIFFCEICRIYVLFGLERDEKDLKVGLPRYGPADMNIHEAMWTHGQSRSKFRYDQTFQWRTYEPVDEP